MNARRYIAVAAFLLPTLSLAFQPVPIPECPAAGPGASAQETIASAKCRARWLIAGAYNRTGGDVRSAVSECVSTFDGVLNHRSTAGVSHDTLVVMCADTAAQMGIIGLD
jgi:hypothetical protein